MSGYLSTVFLRKLLKFAVVGFSGVFVDFSFTFVSKEWLRIPRYIANAIGFTLASGWNYYFNRIWTFESHNPEIMMEFSMFFTVSLIGLLVNTLVLWLLVSKFKRHFYLSKIFAIAVASLWNFLANYYITFV
ncbi:MAG: GtrA family protein [Bacteroidales bacterium]|nr:GtrA family protein [Bacteroidales bacterium]